MIKTGIWKPVSLAHFAVAACVGEPTHLASLSGSGTEGRVNREERLIKTGIWKPVSLAHFAVAACVRKADSPSLSIRKRN